MTGVEISFNISFTYLPVIVDDMPFTKTREKKRKKNKTKRTKTNAKTHNHSRHPNYTMAQFSSYCSVSDTTIADVSPYLDEHKFGREKISKMPEIVLFLGTMNKWATVFNTADMRRV